EETMGLRRMGLLGCGLAFIALGGFRAEARAAGAREPAYRGKPVSAWVAGLKEEDAGSRRAAARALGRIGPGAAAAVGPLAGALRDQDAGVRSAAALALGKIGPAAESAIPTLIGALGDKDQAARAY